VPRNPLTPRWVVTADSTGPIGAHRSKRHIVLFASLESIVRIERKIRTVGTVAIGACVLWIVNWGLNLVPAIRESPPGSAWFSVNTVIAVFALLATAAVPAGLAWAGAGGSRVAVGWLAAWSLGWLVVCAAGVLLLLTGEPNGLLFFIGGNLHTVAGLVAAILVARAAVLGGWRRFAPLAWAVAGAVLGFVQQIETAPAALGLTGELVGYLLIGVVGIAALTTPAARPTAVGGMCGWRP
jgi:hypothetical protein